MFQQGAAWLEAHEEAINALNVFPVPDGDTGTNMLFTLRGALQSIPNPTPTGAGAFLQALSRGALTGARGNSGVILSQLILGMSNAAREKESLEGPDLAGCLQAAAEAAYRVVPKPTEGTILTVIREAATVVSAKATQASVVGVMEQAAATARATVARTPFMLQVLRDNGVVDAGGQGLTVLLEAFSAYLKGERRVPPKQAATRLAAATGMNRQEAPTYGFCTEFLIEECRAEAVTVRERMLALGDSVLVAGEVPLIKVHLHTREPETAMVFARSVGTLAGVKVDNIDAQHQEFAARHAILTSDVAVVAVAAGEGMSALFRSLGAAAVVPGGQTMNPSAGEIARAVASVHAKSVIVLPNNANVVLATEQTKLLVKGQSIEVVPTTDMPQGIAAMMAFNFEGDARSNTEAMNRARGLTKTGEVTRAMRAAKLNERVVQPGDAIGMTDGELVACGASLAEVVEELLRHLGVGEDNAVTLYFGEQLSEAEATRDAAVLRQHFPQTEFSVLAGGQPHYPYLIAVD